MSDLVLYCMGLFYGYMLARETWKRKADASDARARAAEKRANRADADYAIAFGSPFSRDYWQCYAEDCRELLETQTAHFAAKGIGEPASGPPRCEGEATYSPLRHLMPRVVDEPGSPRGAR